MDKRKELANAAKLAQDGAKFYKVILSTRHEIKIDADEIKRVFEAIKTGNPTMLRQALFNPSYYVGIIEDVERRKEYMTTLNRNVEQIKRAIEYDGIETIPDLPKIQLLTDIFAGVQLTMSSGIKQSP